MITLIPRIYYAATGTIVYNDGEHARFLKPNVIIMSRETMLDLEKESDQSTVALAPGLRSGDSDQLFGMRVCYDKGMKRGEFEIAETLKF